MLSYSSEDDEYYYSCADPVKYNRALDQLDETMYDEHFRGGSKLQTHLNKVYSIVGRLAVYSEYEIDDFTKMNWVLDTFPDVSPWTGIKARCLAREFFTCKQFKRLLKAYKVMQQEEAKNPAPLVTSNLQIYAQNLIDNGVVVCARCFKIGHATAQHGETSPSKSTSTTTATAKSNSTSTTTSAKSTSTRKVPECAFHKQNAQSVKTTKSFESIHSSLAKLAI